MYMCMCVCVCVCLLFSMHFCNVFLFCNLKKRLDTAVLKNKIKIVGNIYHADFYQQIT
jgi:hypothetical protein